MAHFKKCFPGPVTQIEHWVGTSGGPPSWDVDIYWIDDLLPEEQIALRPERQVDIVQYVFIADELSGLSRHQFQVLIQWQFLFGHPISFLLKHMHPPVGIMGKRYVFCDIESWSLFKSGTQIRLYYLGPSNVLHDAAIRLNDEIICIYYQGQ